MKFEEGQIFEKNGEIYCVLDIINYNDEDYILMSRENGRIGFIFFRQEHIGTEYNLYSVDDEDMNNKLMEIYERKNLNGQG